ncbi:hypothetical protein JTB14_011044 [Gonioctena quinquepunctata]|nr:hypothetical protein JTB14_011044 [Gonioctena quinquepunctata]
MVTPQNKGDRRPLKVLKERFPEIGNFAGNLKEGEIEYLRTSTKTFTSRGGEEERTKLVYLMPYETDPNRGKDVEKFYDIHHGRKVLECVFRKSGIKVIYLIPASTGGTITNTKGASHNSKPNKGVERQNLRGAFENPESGGRYSEDWGEGIQNQKNWGRHTCALGRRGERAGRPPRRRNKEQSKGHRFQNKNG